MPARLLVTSYTLVPRESVTDSMLHVIEAADSGVMLVNQSVATARSASTVTAQDEGHSQLRQPIY